MDVLRIGQRRRRPKRIGADKGYDSIHLRRQLRQQRMKTAIRHQNFQNRKNPEPLWNDSKQIRKQIRYAPNRWKVERSIACLDQNRRLNFLYERIKASYEGFLALAKIRCYVKVLAKLRIKR